MPRHRHVHVHLHDAGQYGPGQNPASHKNANLPLHRAEAAHHQRIAQHPATSEKGRQKALEKEAYHRAIIQYHLRHG